MALVSEFVLIPSLSGGQLHAEKCVMIHIKVRGFALTARRFLPRRTSCAPGEHCSRPGPTCPKTRRTILPSREQIWRKETCFRRGRTYKPREDWLPTRLSHWRGLVEHFGLWVKLTPHLAFLNRFRGRCHWI